MTAARTLQRKMLARAGTLSNIIVLAAWIAREFPQRRSVPWS
jgi:hypothetical protein